MLSNFLTQVGASKGQLFLIGGLGLAITIILFLILRQVFCWYWKINRMVSLLQSIEQKMAILSNTPSIKEKK
ncbi:MAG: hypothetical protein GX842_03310 [Spirochaetales bacterium]|nr:hypothetical protein [Spirochaetales bacterium]